MLANKLVNSRLKVVLAGLLLLATSLLFFGCSQAPEKAQQAAKMHRQLVQISFEPHFQGKAIQCGQELNIHNEEWKISELAMFFHQFSLNKSIPIILDDNEWQSQNLVLIRSKSNCKQLMHNLTVVGSAETSAPDSLMKALFDRASGSGLQETATLSFQLGVPFDLNHQNPLLQPSPLNDSSMFWAWRNGHKFVRWDMQSNDANTWSFHLGSVGCESAAMVRAPKQACAQPNVLPFNLELSPDSIQIMDKQLANSVGGSEQVIHIMLKLNLDQIIANIKPSDDSTCMFSGMNNQMCGDLVKNLQEGSVFE